MKNSFPLLFVAFGYLFLSYAFQRASPPLEVSDEAGHMEYILRLKERRKLPLVDVNKHSPIGIQELAQPPLYYLIGSALISPIDTGNRADFFHFRPSAPVGRADLPGPMNMWRLDGYRKFPYRQTMLAIVVLRIYSMLLGLGTIILTFKTARLMFPDDRKLPLFAAILIAFNPMFVLIANSINNDNLVSFTVAIGVWMLAFSAAKPFQVATYAGLGAVTSLSLLAKPSGLILLPVAGLHLLLRQAPLRRKIAAALAFAAAAVLLCGWWIYLNMTRYAEPLALHIHSAIARNARAKPDLFALFRPLEWSGFLKSYWGVFGTFNVIYPDSVYTFFFLLSAVLVVLFLVYSSRCFRHIHSGLAWLALLSLTNFAALIWWTSHLMGSQGRLLFPSISAISICFAAGLQVLPTRTRFSFIASISASLFVLCLYAAWFVIPAAYI